MYSAEMNIFAAVRGKRPASITICHVQKAFDVILRSEEREEDFSLSSTPKTVYFLLIQHALYTFQKGLEHVFQV